MSKKKLIYPILMGDVVSSSSYEAKKLGTELKELVDSVNQKFQKSILSPLTITLGDDFQTVLNSVQTGIDIIFCIEEECLLHELDFKLHYVLHTGTIDTEINPDIAYEMLGEGLTTARKMLNIKKRDRKRFKIDIQSKTDSEQLNRLFEVLDSIIMNWKKEDYSLILDMINNENNSEVGDKYNKNRDQIWKRRSTLMIKEYNLLKEVIFTYIR
ncbi:MAG: hypothetical protein JJ971_09790 [Balneolaceae bacterium]|nr:hypothetical protein [Balneolaceae bacterium]MBO6546462.1 hypothetical protein [Balneolaceae bacterium]MBO6648821.1 hypothetical protein [Balneolaceae bacterium]